MFDTESARKLLSQSGVFFCDDPSELDEGEDPRWLQTINMSDTWAWGCADAEPVSDEELPRVAELFFRYGWCGILFWVSEKRGGIRSEFHDNNRFIEFVRQEEAIRSEVPDSSKRAYVKREYTLGNPS